tara:strand:+ start:538 stop:732 length:195 start_codon:yes stop_codon:yes gene_type:complete
MNMKNCAICKREFLEFGNNPWPIKKKGRCCDKCNISKVIPARLLLLEFNTSTDINKQSKYYADE